MLSDRSWKLRYGTEDGDLVEQFYVPALEAAVRYDRLTGYFKADALKLALRGIEGLVRNKGVMRMIVGCTLNDEEISAIARGERLRDSVEKNLRGLAPTPSDAATTDALELLAWMIANKHLLIKIAVPCDDNGCPIADGAIFHEKTGIIEDRKGKRIAWTGSLNETGAGWTRNWESFHVFTSWDEPKRVAHEKSAFDRRWNNQFCRAIVLSLPEAVERDLLRLLPEENALPRRLRDPRSGQADNGDKSSTDTSGKPPGLIIREHRDSLRDLVWSFLRQAPTIPGAGAAVGLATSAVTPWPHQLRAFRRMYDQWPPRLLIADEVGLGKTIQAGLLLRQAWLSGRAKRILVMAPKAVVRQWQIELYEKFNLNWPVYDQGQLKWHPSPSRRENWVRSVSGSEWHKEPAVIASSHLLRRKDRRRVLLEEADPWDLIVLDEAHHARRRGAGGPAEKGPNALLQLLRGLKSRTDGLVLLTATPMQVDPVELWDLLDLLGLPGEWTGPQLLRFFGSLNRNRPSTDAFDHMARLFQAAEQHYGEVGQAEVDRALAGLSRLRAKKVTRALRDKASTPRRLLDDQERAAALKLLKLNTPVSRLVSRHTRELLREYHRKGLLENRIADRQVEDLFVTMTPDERSLYEAVEDYIAETYKQTPDELRRSIGFVLTVYRRRIASSFRALRETLQNRVGSIKRADAQLGLDEDISDDELADDLPEEAAEISSVLIDTRMADEEERIRTLLDRIGCLPPDSKLDALKNVLRELRDRDGYRKIMVFTQYTDTMDFLRDGLAAGLGGAVDGQDAAPRLMCYSGRGGEIPTKNGWRTVDRAVVKRRFRRGEADVLLCTEAAAEGLNFQFCGALINYDMPWNPMRVEQRIGRIDRVGQKHATIRIVNLHYEDTVETDIYRVLRERIGLFTQIVGPLQPILARLPGKITQAVLSGESGNAEARKELARELEQEASDRAAGFDIDTALDHALDLPAHPQSPVTMEDLDRVIQASLLLPPDTKVQRLGKKEYGFAAPGSPAPVRVTTDPKHYEAHADSVELWSPGNELFRPPKPGDGNTREWPVGTTLKAILDGEVGSDDA